MEIAELYQIYLKHPSVQTDTRKLKQGDLFFALSGPNFNGNTFAKEAIEKGAACAVIDDAAYELVGKTIVVANALIALQQLATYHRQQFAIPFIAITGSNGKTTTKELIAAVLQQKFRTYATEGNLNNHIGVPLTLLKIRQDAEMAIIEMGANHQQEIAGYCQIAQPEYGIITNAGKAHMEGFGGVEGVRKGKGELFDFLRANSGAIFRNVDLEYLKSMATGISRQITYGTAEAQYIGIPAMNGVLLDLVMQSPVQAIIQTNLVGDYNAPNILVAVAVGLHFGVTIEQIQEAIGNYHPDNSRSQWVVKGSNKIILDAYNANPTSMKAAITNFANTNLQNKILWIGAMKEMGIFEREEHTQLVALISQYTWADVILVGAEFHGLQQGYKWFADSGAAASFIQANQPSNSSILIKGSRGSKMETMAAALV